jgi:PAS domain S-box-containing protein
MQRELARSIEGLSPRERQLLNLAAQGFTDNAISHRLAISLPTVSTYWTRIRMKLGPMNRTELVAIYLQEQANDTIERLKSENQQLVEQVHSQAQAVTMLRASLNIFRGLIEAAPDSIILVNERGQVELANDMALRMFDYSSEEILQLTAEDLVPNRYRAKHVVNRMSYHQRPSKRLMGEHAATFALRKDGSEFPVAIALSATTTPSGLIITCLVRDITDQFNIDDPK